MRLQLGDFYQLQVNTSDTPDAAPEYTIYSASTPVTNHDGVAIPPVRGDTTFGLPIRLGSDFSVGQYRILVTWEVSSVEFAQEFYFSIVAGGHADGAYIALHSYERPHAQFIVGQTDGDATHKRREPSL